MVSVTFTNKKVHTVIITLLCFYIVVFNVDYEVWISLDSFACVNTMSVYLEL